MMYSITLHVEVEADDITDAYKYADVVVGATLEAPDDGSCSVVSVTIGDVEVVDE